MLARTFREYRGVKGRAGAGIGLLAGLAMLAFSLPAAAESPLTVAGGPIAINQITADQCKDCHEKIYDQWKGSMHAQSSAMTDPIHNAFYRNVVGDPTKEGVTAANGKYPICLQCHAPNAAVDGKTKLDDNPAYAEGVNCVACHRIKGFKGVKKPEGGLRLGMMAYDLGDTLSGPTGVIAEDGDDIDTIAGVDEVGNPHLEAVKGVFLPLEGKSRVFRTADACMGCHDQRPNGNGVPLCATGDEVKASGSNANCQSCHMGNNNGVADHSMGGGHNLGMLKRSVVLDVTAAKDGDTVNATVYLENLQPHTMPTGAPFRNIYVKVTALNADGEPVWQNAEAHPAETDPSAYLHLVLLDGEGKPTTPPKAMSQGPDNRLKPFEKRELAYAIPAEGVASVRAELYYALLWPSLVKNMRGKLPDELLDERRFTFAEAKL